MYTMKCIMPLLLVCIATCSATTPRRMPQMSVLHAINCGGDAYTDTNGINYQKDPTTQGASNNWGQVIQGVNDRDRTIYQSHRWDPAVLTYDIPVTGNGWYGLLLHLSDDSSPALHRRRMSVTLNGQTLLGELDFFRDCGHAIACNHIFYFQLCGNTMHYDGRTSYVADPRNIVLRFQALAINVVIEGILLMKGEAGAGRSIVDTKTVFYFDPKQEVRC